jgi:cation-transporting ATPase I
VPLLSRVTRPARWTLARIVGHERRVWSVDGRAHIEYRAVDEARSRDFADRLRASLLALDGVRWVELVPHLHRVVVATDDEVDADQLVTVVDAVETEFGMAGRAFPADRPDHPADVEPLLSDVIQIVSDALGVGAAVSGRMLRWTPLVNRADLAWAGTLLENVPQLRAVVEDRLGSRATDLLLGVSNSVLRGMTLGLSGHVVDAAARTVSLRARGSLREAWADREPALHPGSDADEAEPPARRERPCPLPDGPIERYMSEAWPVSLGGFAASLIATDDVRRSAAPLLDGIPKAARLGRAAFTSQLVRVLADRGVLVLCPGRLDVLDRADTVIIEADLVSRSTRGRRMLTDAGSALVDAAARSGLDVHMIVADDVPVDAETTVLLTEAGDHVRDLQREGRVVVAVGTAGCPAFPQADVSIGLTPEGRPPPWDADVLCGAELADAYLTVRACGAARRASQQAVTLAMAGAGIGATTGLDGFRRRTGQRVLQVIDTASLLAVGNGVRAASALAGVPRTLTRDTVAWHALPVAEVLDRLGTSTEGLEDDEAARRRTEEAPEPGGVAGYARAAGEELANPLTPVLVGGAGLSLATGSPAEAGMVATVIALNAAVGGAQRYRAEQALADVGRAGQPMVRVRRKGAERQVAVRRLVAGDIVLLETGEAVPADLRIIEAANLEVDESSMTGESVPVGKSPEPTDAAVVADRTSLLYHGTSIAAGTATGVVVATGSQTQARRAIAWAEREDSAPTGVEARLEQITRLTIPMALLSGVGVSVIGLARGVGTRQLVDTSIGLAVASVPEGLPLLATAAQRAAARRLADHRVLVRNARAIEALGRVDVVCADKTGTLTEGRLALTTVSDGRTAVDLDGDEVDEAHTGVLLGARRATPIDPDGGPLPHPTDQAVAEATGHVGRGNGDPAGFRVRDDLPFEPGRAYHAVLADTVEGRWLTVKGAPEAVLDRCVAWRTEGRQRSLDDDGRAGLFEEADRLAARGLRVLAVAERGETADEVTDDDVADLVFVGFVGLRDPVRPMAARSIEQLNAAGVEVVMITGDHPTTARSIADELGLTDGILLTGPDVDDLDDDALADQLPKVSVFARVTPEHKVRIVRTFQRLGRTVAMTGDGANDAPAIRLADVGIAVGERATAAARETADVVILDDRLEVIVDAIAEGRGLWASVRDAVSVLVGGNLGEIGFTLLGSVLSRIPPMNARQLLFVNLLTDVAPAMALAVREPQAAVEERLREGPQTSLGGALNRAVVWRGTGTAAGATAAFTAARFTGSAARARTVGTVALVGAQLGQTLATSARDPRVVATGAGTAAVMATAIQVPGLSQLVGCRPMGPVGWATAVAGATVGTLVGIAGPTVERVVGGVGFSSRAVDRLSALAADLPDAVRPG